MPRIRKKTSNRASTNDRAKVRHKVKETRKKKARAAKKNPQWKSRKPKDPGIPNEFPYKDQILAEVAEQRRIEVEEKERRKAEKKNALNNAKAIAHGEVIEDTRPRHISEQENDGTKEEKENREEEVPILINRDLPTLQSVLEKADVILEVLDARDPMVFRSEHVEQLVKDAGKKMLLVLNKIDTCPREALTAWAAHLRMQCPALMFRSATAFLPEGPTMQDPLVKKVKGKGKAKVPIDDALGAEPVLNCLSQWAKEKEGEEALTVAVIGVTNVGKSSLINSLLKRAALPIYTLASSSRGPSTTEIPQEVTLEIDSQKIVLIDTPGLSFASSHEEEVDDQSTLEEFRARDILLRNKGRIDRLKDPYPPIAHIVSRANAEDLMLLYSLPAFTKGDTTAFLSGVARSNQLVKKKGELDLAGAARIVLRDWSIGKFDRFTTPSSAPPVINTAAATTQSESSLYVNDEAILSTIQTRKERRKRGGLVRFTYGSIDPRKVAVEEPWNGEGDDDEEEVDDEIGVEGDVEGMDIDEDEENEGEGVDEDEEEEEEASDAESETGDSQEEGEEDADQEDEDEGEGENELPRLSRKQKRKRGPEKSIVPSPPVKKVAFSVRPPARGLKKTDRQKKKGLPTMKMKAAEGSRSKDKSGSEVYDFGKFF